MRQRNWTLSVALVCGWFAFGDSVFADRFSLVLHYQLPTVPDLVHDAQLLDADALSHRNIEIQACANGNERSECEKQAEIAFRRRIAAIPGARFSLYYNNVTESWTHGPWLMDLSAEEAVDRRLDREFNHLAPGSNYGSELGLVFDTSTCTLRYERDNSRCKYNVPVFVNLMCQMLRKSENATYLFADLIDHGSKESPTAAEIEFLLAHHALEDVKRGTGVSALWQAASRNELEIVKLLIREGVDVNVSDPDGGTALCYAAQGGALDSVKFLVEHGAEVNPGEGRTPLMYAAGEGKTDVVDYLISWQANVNATYFGRTALARAAGRGHLTTVKLLLAKDAAIDGGCALCEAARGGYLEVVKYLVDHGASVNLRTDGVSPLALARENRSDEIVRLLLAHGAKE